MYVLHRFFEKNSDRKHIEQYDKTTEHDHCMDAREFRKKSSDKRSHEKCEPERCSHHSHTLRLLTREGDIRYICLDHSEPCSSESTDKSGSEKEEKYRSKSLKKSHGIGDDPCRFPCLKSHRRRPDIELPDTHKHDEISDKIEYTGIRKHFFATIRI